MTWSMVTDVLIIAILYNNNTKYRCRRVSQLRMHKSLNHSLVLDYGFIKKVTSEWLLCELYSLEECNRNQESAAERQKEKVNRAEI